MTALKKSPAKRLNLPVPLLLFIAVFPVYAFFFGGSGWNQFANFAIARALVERHTLQIDPYSEWTGDVTRANGHVYSNKPPGVGLLAVAPYAIVYGVERAARIPFDDPLISSRNEYLCSVLIVATLGATIPVFVFLFGRLMGFGECHSAAIALFCALATPLFPYATAFYSHVPTASFLLMSLWYARAGKAAAAGFLGSLAVLTYYPSLGCLIVLGALAIYSARKPWRAAAAFVAAGLPAAALLLWYQHTAFGDLLHSPVHNSVYETPGLLFGVYGLPSARVLLAITVLPYRGLFFLAPLLLMAFPGAVAWWRSRRERVLLACAAACAVFFFVTTMMFNGWHGGSALGPRYVIPAIPFLALFLLWVRAGSVATLALAAASFVNVFAGAAVDIQPSGSTTNPLFTQTYPTLLFGDPGTGEHTSTALFAFNWGEVLFGSGSVASLVPILVWIALVGWAMWSGCTLARREPTGLQRAE